MPKAAFGLYFDHGIWSAFQALGLELLPQCAVPHDPLVIMLVLFLGFISVPVSVMAGWLRKRASTSSSQHIHPDRIEELGRLSV